MAQTEESQKTAATIKNEVDQLIRTKDVKINSLLDSIWAWSYKRLEERSWIFRKIFAFGWLCKYSETFVSL